MKLGRGHPQDSFQLNSDSSYFQQCKGDPTEMSYSAVGVHLREEFLLVKVSEPSDRLE